MAPQFIYVMKDLRKVVPPQPGDPATASGSRSIPARRSACSAPTARASRRCCASWPASTRIFRARRGRAKGTRIGYLPQEPQLDPTKDVQGNVELAVAKQRALLTKFEEISMKFAEPMTDDEMTKLLERAGARCRSRSTRTNLWKLDDKIEIAMDALRLPPADADVTNALGRREASRRAVPGAARAARHAAARRADEPSRRRERRVARAVSRGVSGNRRRDHARSLLPRQRREVDSRARSRRGHSVRGQLQRVARAEARASRSRKRRRESARQRTLQRELEWVRMAPRARQAKSKARIQKYEELGASDTVEKVSQNEIIIPPPPRLGNDVVIAKDVKKSVRRQAAVRRI